MTLSSLTLALTAYNEGDNLSNTIARAIEFLPKAADAYELLIIDDGSTDSTPAIAERLAAENSKIRVICHPRNLGMGAAIRTAIRETKMKWFCTIAGDGQVNPNDLLTFVEPAQYHPAVFSTYSTRQDGVDRWILSNGLRILIFLISGVWKIPTGNYFIQSELIRSFPFTSESFVVNYEVFLNVRKRKLSYVWVQIPCTPRASGKSKVRNLKTIFRVARELIRYRLFGS